MGGWMTYGRFRSRNILPRNEEPYPAGGSRCAGDLDRMERDYLNPVYPEPPWALRESGSDPSAQVAAATGVDVETVRRVLRYVFLQQK